MELFNLLLKGELSPIKGVFAGFVYFLDYVRSVVIKESF